MSLKAKLEAVIYAAEEPVTLAQLASLFAEEALRSKAEQAARAGVSEDRRTGEEEPAGAGGYSDSTPELAELLAVVEELPGESAIAASEASLLALGEASSLNRSDGLATEGSISSEEGTESTTESDTPAAGSGRSELGPELEAKRLEQKRNREVREILRGIIEELIADYASDSRGIEIREIAGGFRMGTKPEIHDAVRSFVKSLKPALKLSLPALETLAVIAYKQPVTAPEVADIRGVDSTGVLGSLMSRKLITTAGRKPVVGRPMLYKTTKEFLLRFGLKDVNELPSMEEFEKIAALELSETDGADLAGESYAEAVAESGDLFAEKTEPFGSTENLAAEENDSEAPAPASKEEADTAPFIPTAEPSAEAAEAHALVERLNAEEVEAER